MSHEFEAMNAAIDATYAALDRPTQRMSDSRRFVRTDKGTGERSIYYRSEDRDAAVLRIAGHMEISPVDVRNRLQAGQTVETISAIYHLECVNCGEQSCVDERLLRPV